MWKIIKLTLIALLAVFVLWFAYELATFPRTARLRNQNPETTSIMEQRANESRERGAEARRVQYWVPLDRISPNLQRAVLAGEDAHFATHNGFDYEAIRRAWDDAQREAEREARQEGNNDSSDWLPSLPSFGRGASTVTQQLAKNLYLSTERSFLRKGREAAITYFLERDLSKQRILEIYLNVIEWGDGIYGAEAAARHYFNKPAANLNAREAAFLSAIIPNPRTVFNPQTNPRRVTRRARIITRGMPHVRLPAADQ